MASDTEYFRLRASEERTAALQARDERVRKAHLELADRYEDLVRGIAAHADRLGLSATGIRHAYDDEEAGRG